MHFLMAEHISHSWVTVQLKSTITFSADCKGTCSSLISTLCICHDITLTVSMLLSLLMIKMLSIRRVCIHLFGGVSWLKQCLFKMSCMPESEDIIEPRKEQVRQEVILKTNNTCCPWPSGAYTQQSVSCSINNDKSLYCPLLAEVKHLLKYYF